MRFAARASSATDAGAVDLRGDELRIAGEKAQEVDVLEHADDLALARHRDAALVVLRHHEQRDRDEVVGRDRDDGTAGERTDRRIDRRRSRIAAFIRSVRVTTPIPFSSRAKSA